MTSIWEDTGESICSHFCDLYPYFHHKTDVKTQLLCCLNNVIPPNSSHLKWIKTPSSEEQVECRVLRQNRLQCGETRVFLKRGGIRDRFTKTQVHQGKGIGAQGCPTAYYFKRYDFSFVGMLELDFFFHLKGTAFAFLLSLSIRKERAFSGSWIFFSLQTRGKFWFPLNIYFTYRKMALSSSWLLFSPST